MPELGHYNPEISSKLSKEIKRLEPGHILNDRELSRFLEKRGEEFLGSGNECVVITDSRSDSKVAVAFSYEEVSPESAKKTFYLQRVFSTLFPNNFPHFHLSKSVNQKGQVSSVRELIDVEHLGTKGAKSQHPFKKVYQLCQKLGIKVIFDGSGSNWAVDKKGDEYYVDSLHSANFSEWDSQKITDYMKKNKYSENDISVIKMCIDRLRKLPDTYYADKEAVEKFLKMLP